MPRFRYKARDDEGRSISGEVNIAGEEELRKRLENNGFYLVQFSIASGNIFSDDIAERFQRVSLKDLYSFTLQLSNTVGSGVPLLTSLNSIVEGCKNKKLISIVDNIVVDLRSGSSLSKALSKYSKLFSEFYINMVELGESSGKLSHILNILAEYIKKEMVIKNRVRSALIYPIVVVVVGSCLIGYILTFIMPQFAEIFAREKVLLPLPTIILLSLSDAVVRFWYVFIGLFIGFIFGFRLFARSDYGRLIIDQLKLKIPVVGNVVKKVCAKRFIDGLSLLYVSGFPLLGAIKIVKSMLSNKHLEKIIDALWVHISTGKDFASYLWLCDFFPPNIVTMIRSGEETGTLDKMLEKISAIYHDEVNNAIDGLISAFEIAVILMLGSIVAFAVMAIMFPIFSLSRIVTGR